eukprot:Phypoly_transcript_00306.p1 GENE.Phypoly_transcript_00306~~Phypoly_transcript_00306.p1  ORF type:complete len:1112 (+),score=182.86 Phypoly_transcript_00306:1977-5312(+)
MVDQWTASDTAQWLNSLGMNGYARFFLEQAINGKALLQLTDEELYTPLQVKTLGHRKLLLSLIDELRVERFSFTNGFEPYLSPPPSFPLNAPNPSVDPLSLPAPAPFATDEEYIACVEFALNLQRTAFDAQDRARAALLEKGNEGEKAYLAKIFARFSVLAEKAHAACDSRAELGYVPRLVRLCKKLGLTPKELRALQYVVICNLSTSNFPPPPAALHSTQEQKAMSSRVSRYANMSAGEILDFLRGSRLHMTQGLIEIDDEFSTTFTSHFLTVGYEVLRALCGRLLTTDEFFKIDKTALAEVLTEEPGFFHESKEEGTSNLTKKAKETIKRGKKEDKELGELEKEMEGLEVEGEGEEGSEGDEETKRILKAIEDGEDVLDTILGAPENTTDTQKSGLAFTPYLTDLEYLEDQFELLECKLRIKKLEFNEDEISIHMRSDQRRPEAILREFRAKERAQKSKVENKLALTLQNGDWLPRLETLVKLRGLDDFEKDILVTLIGGMISQKVRKAGNLGSSSIFPKSFDVGTLLSLHTDSLEQHIRSRTYFYKNSKLVQEGIIKLWDPPFNFKKGGTDLMDSTVEIDRKLLDYLVGLDSNLNELVEGGDLSEPKVTLDQVVLPQEQKHLILSTLSNWGVFVETRKKLGIDETLHYGKGLVLLFTGPSGTGKTMTANGLANFLHKKLLTLSLSSLGDSMLNKELLRFIFREANIHDAIVFFDECEGLFESRNGGKTDVGALLTEIEKFDGLLILATTRPYDLDEALHRRITLVIDFMAPDYEMRSQIWKSIWPPHMPISSNVEWQKLAMDYELTGGLIKNAFLSALSLAISRDAENVLITNDDLFTSAKQQLQAHLQMAGFERRVVPKTGLTSLILPPKIYKTLFSAVNEEKARKVLVGKWGMEEGQGTVLLLRGPNGSGLRSVAKALGYELGRPLKEYLCAELSRINKNIETIFSEAKLYNAIVVLHDADSLLNYAGRPQNSLLDSSALLYHIRQYSGIVILTSRSSSSQSSLDLSIFGRTSYSVELGVFSADIRRRIWEKLMPTKHPLDGVFDWDSLSSEYEFTAGSIQNTITKAAEAATLQNQGITMKGLKTAANEERKRLQSRVNEYDMLYG